MADFDYNTRRKITEKRKAELEGRIRRLSGYDRELAQELAGNRNGGGKVGAIAKEFYGTGKKPSQWFERGGLLAGMRAHKGLLDAFVPAKYQESYLYMIDKLNQFPFSSGWSRRTVRTAGYGPQIRRVFSLLLSYEALFYIGDRLEDYIYKRLDAEKLDYIKHEWSFTNQFSLIYAGEIDRGNQAVIQAFKDLILSENNTAYLDREMILGILRSDNQELHKLLGDLLLAARLQEGLRQVICETMDEGTEAAFLALLKVIEEHDLIRYSSVKRAVSTWIGIFDEKSADRITGKLLTLMGQCLRDPKFCREQLKTNDSIAISVALWALGFKEAEDAVAAMSEMIDHGTKNQKLTASLYNQSLFDTNLKFRMAKKVVLECTDDIELVAAFMPSFTVHLHEWIRELLFQEGSYSAEREEPKKAVVTDYFQDRGDAQRQYEKLGNLYRQLPKKGVVYDPCIFPWYRVALKPSEIIRMLAFIAYVLQDEEKITEMAALIGEVSGSREYLLSLLLSRPTNPEQRKLLIQYMGNAETATSRKAASLVKRLSLRQEEYRLMEDMLRFKRGKLRGELLEFLMGQGDAWMEECLKRLLADSTEEKRSAGLDLLLRLSKKEEKAELCRRVNGLAAGITNPTDKEKLLLEEILGGTPGEKTKAASEQKGFGIYDPDAPEILPEPEEGRDIIARCLPLSEKEIIEKLKKLDALFRENQNYEYETAFGDRMLLGNSYVPKKREDGAQKTGSVSERCRLGYYPLEEKFRAFYEQELKSYGTFLEWEARMLLQRQSVEIYHNGRIFYEAVFGRAPFQPEPVALEYLKQFWDVRLNYRYEFLDRKLLFEASLQAVGAMTKVVNKENKIISYHYTGWNGRQLKATTSLEMLPFLDRFLGGLKYWETDEEFTRAFFTAFRFELQCSEEREKSQFLPTVGPYNSLSTSALTHITPYWFLKAYHMELISRDILLKAILNYFDRRNNLEAITQIVKGEYKRTGNRVMLSQFFVDEAAEKILEQGEALVGEDTWCGKLIRELYEAIVPLMVDTELRRGEGETPFSEDMCGITYIQGIPYLVRILKALGKDTLGRKTYYSWYYSSSTTRQEVLSRLLKACYPAEGEDGQTLGKALKGTSIKTDRLVEVAMYAPQWIDIIQEYLGWQGLKSGCYYFMAHMNERFDDQKMAVIAKYTPLSAEELQDGAFDIDWFREAYGMLGEKNFELLYKAAKYISNGQKHSRARKYADAAAGKVTLDALREQICDKRNKDLLMSYGLVPFSEKREQDMLGRYQFIRSFAKEAKQFGAQRRASETKAAELALVNLSVHGGFADVTRLTLNMESKLAEEFAAYMEWNSVEDVEIRLHVDETGKSEILCRKGEKPLKSLPARLGKNPYVLEVKDAHKKLKEQYSRAKKLMEESMESGAFFTAAEVSGLLGNPVVRAILLPLVFVCEGEPGFLQQDGEAGKMEMKRDLSLKSWDGRIRVLNPDEKLHIAHPLDLYRAGLWHEYQQYLFDHGIRQPFKQVFRELYVKLPEELGLKASRMFAGNQIQPQKTVGCLKGRRWIADYEEGLQKVYYKENIIARIYALADWFSPSDAEEPTLEWVEFSDRKTFEALTIEQVPDLIYSEVMRDVDLAVSVAHAGGVDPETSHSTIEMRRAIVEFNLPLFKLGNVTLKESHALIQGTRGNYSVHLGSGVVHQEGGAMINILPVHSQKRGKLFLPFVDEDPKTAEIMSKIVLLAEDKKIKDPFILDQIHGV